MSKRFRFSTAAAGVVIACAASGASSEAFAWGIRECSGKYEAAKEANQLNGQSWREFFKACRADLAKPTGPAPGTSATAEPAPAPKPEAAPAPAAAEVARAPAPAPASEGAPAPAGAANSSRAPSANAAAENAASSPPATRAERWKQCEAEWKAQGAHLRKNDRTATWQKYWTACDKRLSAAIE